MIIRCALHLMVTEYFPNMEERGNECEHCLKSAKKNEIPQMNLILCLITLQIP